ncbi:MAG TPA: hypothetical protein VFV84_09970 [Burkholderiales bacterium]|nr:hypothetical protein [Burkholderiales bacterium]
MNGKLAAALAGLVLAAPARALEEPYAAVVRGTRCDLEADASLTCRYRVGAGLEFVLRRVGGAAPRLEVIRDNREGDYTLDPVRHGTCLFVRFGWTGNPAPGMEHQYATVSMVNGLAYRSLARCAAAR